MSSIREQIMDAVVTAWNTSPPAGVPTLIRAKFKQVVLDDAAPLSAECDWLEDEEAASDKDSGPLQFHKTSIGFECRAVGDGSEVPSTMLDPIYVHASSVFNDNRLGGLVDSLRLSGSQLSRSTEGVTRPTALMGMFLEAKYSTAAKDAAKRA